MLTYDNNLSERENIIRLYSWVSSLDSKHEAKFAELLGRIEQLIASDEEIRQTTAKALFDFGSKLESIHHDVSYLANQAREHELRIHSNTQRIDKYLRPTAYLSAVLGCLYYLIKEIWFQ